MTKKTAAVEKKVKPLTIRDLEIINAPVITEKTQSQQANLNKITFAVKGDANKTEIKLAVEALFNTKVEQVNIINVLPRKKRMGKYEGTVKGFKKAVVTLDKDAKFNPEDATKNA